MTQFIDKSAVVAEIERKLNSYHPTEITSGRYALTSILDFLDTLEVKEVDFDAEQRNYLTEHFNVYENGVLQSKRSSMPLDTLDVIRIAKHFFELGIRAAQKGE